MIHTHRRDGCRCGGTLIPDGPRRFLPAAEMARCEKCGQVGVPYIPAPKTRSRPGESLSDSARAASVLSCDPPHSIQVSNHSHKVIRRLASEHQWVSTR